MPMISSKSLVGKRFEVVRVKCESVAQRSRAEPPSCRKNLQLNRWHVSKINCAAAHWRFFIFFSRSLSLLINSKCLQKKKPACGLLCRVGTDECRTEIRLLIGGVVLWLFFFISSFWVMLQILQQHKKIKVLTTFETFWRLKIEMKKTKQVYDKEVYRLTVRRKVKSKSSRQCHLAVRHVVTECLWFKRTHVFAGLLCCHFCRC